MTIQRLIGVISVELWAIIPGALLYLIAPLSKRFRTTNEQVQQHWVHLQFPLAVKSTHPQISFAPAALAKPGLNDPTKRLKFVALLMASCMLS